ncbi:homoserine dehydrogenase [Salinisphaera shabanensis T35B1]|uniref:Homoserine dehydrogenase n=1 Tax=Salinisphaera shabanensis E1L3A TaxID=1033802 RepID=U2EPC1_9GAMM|nr:homoserine dehydrogenase [Salinisphaera shabanensis]ERJ19947.1 Homoserine dehydrogenase protein [Salinisphaera shabanensis E1L3A]
MQPVNVGLLGLGTVGAGAVNLLERNGVEIARRAGREIRVVRAAVRNPDKTRECATSGIEIGTDCNAVVTDPNIDVVIELIGGDTQAYDLVMAAIANGKHVVTANKHLIALHGNEIFAAADEAGVVVSFEAAVAGGIPIIKAMRESLAANHIEWVAGIINGTGNFILSQMIFEDQSFEDALADAQRLGFAEADPTFDVEGIDAAHKLAIIGAIAFGIPLSFDKIFTQGIRDIDSVDIEYCAELGYRIKHLGIARRGDNGVEMRVHPTLVSQKALLANVEGEKNAIMVYGDAVGPTVYYGAGAGAGPTASSVVADLIDTVRIMSIDPKGRVPHLAFQPDEITDEPIVGSDDFVCGHYFRVQVADQIGVMAEITRALADQQIGIEAILQKDPPTEEDDARVMIVTKAAREGQLMKVLDHIRSLPYAREGIVHMRVAQFED